MRGDIRRRVAAAIVAIVVAGCGGTGTGSSAPSGAFATSTSGSTAPGTTAPATPRATLRPSPTAAARAWQPVPRQPSVTRGQWQDVTWTGAGFIAVGPSLTSGGALLDSVDGLHWRSQRSGGASGYPRRVAGGPRGVVAIGKIGREAASWVSKDGLTWRARTGALPTSLDGTDVVTVTDVVAMPDGWLAVGREDPRCSVACGQHPLRALAWTSPDGLRWTRVPDAPSLRGGGMNAVAAAETGYVAVGTAAGHAAIWRSDDALAWTRVPDDPMFGPPEDAGEGAWVDANGVAVDNGTIVVAGMAFGAGDGGAPIATILQFDDGLDWAAAGVERAMASRVFAVTATADGFIATGPSGDPGCASGIWTSADGLIWPCQPSSTGMRGFAPYAAAGSLEVQVVVGLTNAGSDASPGLGAPGAIWWRPRP